MSTIKIDVKLISRTDLALLVSDGQREAWIPLSEVVEEFVVDTGALSEELKAIEIPAWLAAEKGLLQRLKDTDTVDMFGGTP